MNLRAHRWFVGAFAIAITAFTANGLNAQSTMSSTLRHGSGYLDNPSANVLPHMAIQGTFSGFFIDVNPLGYRGPNGTIVPAGPGQNTQMSRFNSDASITVGLFDRAEAGVSLLSLSSTATGGTLYSVYGRLALLKPEAQGFGLAVGGRYYNSPSFNGVETEPNRLAYPDPLFNAANSFGADTNMTLYAVGTFFLRGFEADWFPKNDITFSAGYGGGMFSQGAQDRAYTYTNSNGFFAGSNFAVEIGENTALNFISEWNGFDLNMGAQVDISGVRLGAHVLGMNHASDLTQYRSKKIGVLASVGICGSGFCKPEFIDRPEPEVIQLPAPAPDTVIVTREVAPTPPSGNPTNICLATGQDVRVLMTAQGDTLVGNDRVSIRTLRPGVVFAGTYADGRAWYTNDEDVRYDERNYSKSGNPVSLQCTGIMRIGEHMGVPVFAQRSAEQPYETIYVPVRPGAWQAYQTLRGTRGF